MIYIYRKLVASFTEIKGFDGWMIAKAEFKTKKKGYDTLNDTGNNIKFIKMRKSYSVISSNIIYNDIEYTLIMDIAKPGSISGINTGKLAMKAASNVDCI